MVLSIYDPATGLNDPNIGQTVTEPNPFMKLLGDRNFINLLAGVGGSLDPKGVAGNIGRSTIAYTGAQAAQERAASNAEAQNQQTKMLLDALEKHGGLTPKGTPGLTSATATDDGIKLDITGELSGQAGSGSSSTPVAQETPPAVTPPATTAPATPTQSSTLSAEENKRRIASILPFYSAPLV